MILGNKIGIYLQIFIVTIPAFLRAEDIITSAPLINLDKIKPSFEEIDINNEKEISKQNLKNKKKDNYKSKSSHAVLIGLDKITAKSSQIVVNLDEAKNFGQLEIKILKCGKVKVNNKIDDIAYMQVKDLTKNENEKVFIFNGWTFSSDTTLTPFDHAIYDLQLVNCYNT